MEKYNRIETYFTKIQIPPRIVKPTPPPPPMKQTTLLYFMNKRI